MAPTRGCSRAGLVSGGGYGVFEGLKSSQGERQRIRINAVLNSTGKHGPGLGNSVAALGMMFSGLESIAYNVRGEDDLLNVIGAGALTGGIFKSQAVRIAARAPLADLAGCVRERAARAAPPLLARHRATAPSPPMSTCAGAARGGQRRAGHERCNDRDHPGDERDAQLISRAQCAPTARSCHRLQREADGKKSRPSARRTRRDGPWPGCFAPECSGGLAATCV